jgi:murein tripeptide amidase MpaA
MHINTHFDSGNIRVVSAASHSEIVLEINKDVGDEHGQWFHFQLCGARGQDCVISIANAGDMSYPGGFEDYRAVASNDLEHWFRIDSSFDGQALTLHHRPETDAVYFAYFAPYSFQRHQRLVARALASPRARAEVLCSTPDGHPLTLLTVGEAAPARKSLWFIARQHPGETMAEWWMEGFLERLLDPEEPVAGALLEQAVVYVVPNMNPDGSVRGHLRCNARGVNLNRAWKDPDEQDSPEVYFTRQRMHETGVDFFLDVHGDEVLPYNFIAGGEGVPSWNEARNRELQSFKARLAGLSPDFQTRHGYAVNAPNSSDLRKATDYVSEQFGCLAMTLEMPFKDNADRPDATRGWSPGRSKHLGAACLQAVWQTLQDS